MPSIIFVIYSGHKAREKSKLESEAKKRQKERAQRTTGKFPTAVWKMPMMYKIVQILLSHLYDSKTTR